MEPKLISTDYDSFIVHFKKEGSDDYNMRWSGTVTQIQMCTDGTWEYQSNDSSCPTKELKDARVWFEWSFCWRGCWEGRVYFKDDEYWGEEMKTIPEIWERVEEIIKRKIRSDNPGYDFGNSY